MTIQSSAASLQDSHAKNVMITEHNQDNSVVWPERLVQDNQELYDKKSCSPIYHYSQMFPLGHDHHLMLALPF